MVESPLFGVLVVSEGSHRTGGSGWEGNLIPGAGVALRPSHEEGETGAQLSRFEVCQQRSAVSVL